MQHECVHEQLHLEFSKFKAKLWTYSELFLLITVPSSMKIRLFEYSQKITIPTLGRQAEVKKDYK